MSRIWVGFFYFFEIGLGLNTDGFVGGIGWDFRGEFLSIELESVFLFYLFIYLFIFIYRRRRRSGILRVLFF